jgi:A-macroglobulin TED domain
LSILQSKSASVISNGMEFLKTKSDAVLRENNLYEKAIVFYAFVLNGQDSSLLFKDLKKRIKFSGNDITTNTKYKVEIASYIALGLIKLANNEEALKYFSFLLTKRRANGGFESTHDTALGLQAMFELSNEFYAPRTDLRVTVNDKIFNIKQHNDNDVKEIELPVTNNVKIDVSGYGTVMVAVTHSYKVTVLNDLEFFDVSVLSKLSTNLLDLNICVKTKTEHSNMAIVDLKLPSGYVFIKPSDDSQQLLTVLVQIFLNQLLILFSRTLNWKK